MGSWVNSAEQVRNTTTSLQSLSEDTSRDNTS